MSQRSVRLCPDVVSSAHFQQHTLARMRRFEQQKQDKLLRLARDKRLSAERELSRAARRVAKDEQEKDAVIMSAVSRLDSMIRKKEERLERERLSSLKAKRDRDLDECTFRPKTSSRSSSMKRGLDDLLHWKSDLLKKNLAKQLEQAQASLNQSSRTSIRAREPADKSVAATIDRLYKHAFLKKSLRLSSEAKPASRPRRASVNHASRRSSAHNRASSRYDSHLLQSAHPRQPTHTDLSIHASSSAFRTPGKPAAPQVAPDRHYGSDRDSASLVCREEAGHRTSGDSAVGELLHSEVPGRCLDPSRSQAQRRRLPTAGNTGATHINSEQLRSEPSDSKAVCKQIKFKKTDRSALHPSAAKQAGAEAKHAGGDCRDRDVTGFTEDRSEETLAQIPLRKQAAQRAKHKQPLFKEGDTRTTKTSNDPDLKKSGLLCTLDRMIDTSIKRDNQGKSQQSRHLQSSRHEATLEGTSNSTLPRRDSKSPEKEDPSGIDEIGIREFIQKLDHDPQRELAKRRSESKSRANRSKLQERMESIFKKDRSAGHHAQHPQTLVRAGEDSLPAQQTHARWT